MEYQKYLDVLTERFNAYFNIKKHCTLFNKDWDLSAEFINRENHTFISKNTVMDYADSKEMFVVTSSDTVMQDFKDFILSMPSYALEYSGVLSRHHKSSKLTAVIVCNTEPCKKIIKAVKGFNYSKLHYLGFYGMTYAGAVLVDLQNSKVYTSPLLKKDKAVFMP